MIMCLKTWHPGCCQMAVLKEHPASLEDLCLSNQLLGLGSLAPPQGNHVQGSLGRGFLVDLLQIKRAGGKI
ncbi:hypothetical protein MAR_001987 [Mya arenaria]|uniref:Uncharacterized protein n=1 Tax=Mya arenaria TaxID=6604 RepID=A0ABY7FH01_MYAAR|nr:hypothetical protein MAR_001987 [Mya arenaria]